MRRSSHLPARRYDDAQGFYSSYLSLATNYVLGPGNNSRILAQVTLCNFRGQASTSLTVVFLLCGHHARVLHREFLPTLNSPL